MLITKFTLILKVMTKNKKWHCPHCCQTSTRHWNLKTHIERKHQGIEKPIREDEWHSNYTASTAMHVIPDMIIRMQNNSNYYQNHQKYPYTFSASPYSKKEEETSKKRDAIDEFLEFWRPIVQKMKEVIEIKKFLNELSSFSSSQQDVNTGLLQTPIIDTIIPPVTTTTPLQPTTPPQPAQSSQEQEQKKKIINPGADLITNLFINSTFMASDLQRRARGLVKEEEDFIIILQEPSLAPYMMTTTSDNNNRKKRGEPNPITENTKEQELKEDRHNIEEYHIKEHPSSKSNLFIDKEDDFVINNNIDYDDDSSDINLVIKRDKYGDIYE